MKFSNEEKVDMLFVYARAFRNANNAAQLYAELYPERRIPNSKLFAKLERNLLQYGSFESPQRRNATVTLEGGVGETNVLGIILHKLIFLICSVQFILYFILGYVHFKNVNDAEVSLREIEKETGLGRMSAKKILRRNKFRHYRCRKVQHLRNTDYRKRRIFCRWLLREKRQDADILKKIIWTDESRFCNNGWFNRNIHYRWTQENRHFHRETAFQERFGINVWLGILDTKVVGPFFFDEHLTGELYFNFLTTTLQDLLDNVPLNVLLNFKYFQHDGAPAHRDQRCTRFLHILKPNHWIGNNGPINWPPRSPDITPMDFSIWGFIKDQVYKTTPQDVEDLKQQIRAACEKITPRMLSRVQGNLNKRARKCLQNHGSHFEHLL
jgi:Helix-turn-helix domain (DUF4817)